MLLTICNKVKGGCSVVKATYPEKLTLFSHSLTKKYLLNLLPGIASKSHFITVKSFLRWGRLWSTSDSMDDSLSTNLSTSLHNSPKHKERSQLF